jgi:hypothetical protein
MCTSFTTFIKNMTELCAALLISSFDHYHIHFSPFRPNSPDRPVNPIERGMFFGNLMNEIRPHISQVLIKNHLWTHHADSCSIFEWTTYVRNVFPPFVFDTILEWNQEQGMEELDDNDQLFFLATILFHIYLASLYQDCLQEMKQHPGLDQTIFSETQLKKEIQLCHTRMMDTLKLLETEFPMLEEQRQMCQMIIQETKHYFNDE